MKSSHMTTYILVNIIPLQTEDRGFIVLGTKLLFIIIPTLVVHVVVSSLFGLEEVEPVIAKLRQIIFRPIRIQ